MAAAFFEPVRIVSGFQNVAVMNRFQDILTMGQQRKTKFKGLIDTTFLDTFWAISGPESVHQPVQLSMSGKLLPRHGRHCDWLSPSCRLIWASPGGSK
jgi:hypothetical protein